MKLRFSGMFLFALFTVAMSAPAADALKLAKLNVLFIAVDDLRTSLGCYGDKLAKAPNIDRLAESARIFDRAYVQQAVCGPSRTSLLTGRLPDHTRNWHINNRFRDVVPDVVTLPQLFKNNGYHAQSIGKVFHTDDPQSWSVKSVRNAGGEKYVGSGMLDESTAGKKGAYEAADVADEAYWDANLARLAVETLGQLKTNAQPFFLAVGFMKPHLPFNCPKKYWDLYDPATFALEGKRLRTRGAPEVAYPDHLELGGYKDMPDDEKVSSEQARTLRHGYYACVSYVDAQIGKVLRALQELGFDQNTIVILWGDHGFSLGEADHWCKDTNFEMDTRVPFLVRVPGMKSPGVATEAIIECVDVYPTLVEMAGLRPPAGLDGRSFVPILHDPNAPGRDLALSQFSRPFKPTEPQVMGYSLRTVTHRYTRWIEWPTRKTMAEELYDYTAPASAQREGAFLVEQQNVVTDSAYTQVRDILRAKMDQVLAKRSIPKPAPEGITRPKGKGGRKAGKQ